MGKLKSKYEQQKLWTAEANETIALLKEEIDSLKTTNSNLETKDRTLAQSLTASSEEFKAQEVKLEQLS